MKKMLDLLYAGRPYQAWYEGLPMTLYFKYVKDDACDYELPTAGLLTTMLLLIAVAEGETL